MCEAIVPLVFAREQSDLEHLRASPNIGSKLGICLLVGEVTC